MSRQYYYLVAGLPDVFFDDKKLSATQGEYRAYLGEYLTEKEQIIETITSNEYDFLENGKMF